MSYLFLNITYSSNFYKEVGNGGMTTAEERAHFGIWAISKSPLILGTDLSKISAASLAIISNSVSCTISYSRSIPDIISLRMS